MTSGVRFGSRFLRMVRPWPVAVTDQHEFGCGMWPAGTKKSPPSDGHTRVGSLSVSFSPDGQTLASGSDGQNGPFVGGVQR